MQPWQLFTLAGLIGATIVVFMSRGQTPSAIVLLSLVIFTAAIVGIGTWRMLSPLTGTDDSAGPQILGGRTRAALEREKALALRSLKELEFDRAMGKMSEKDFAEMSTRLRTRAAGLIRQLDAGGGYRDQIEKEVQKRAKRGGPQGAALQPQENMVRADVGPADVGRADVGRADVGRAFTARHICSECQAENDPDAKFCKNCGARMEMPA